MFCIVLTVLGDEMAREYSAPGEKMNPFKVLVGKSEEKGPLRRGWRII
jgi:hypothetical protein